MTLRHQTKIMLNSVSARPKLSTLDKMTSFFVILIFIFLVVLCTCLGLIYAIWEYNEEDLVARYISGVDWSFMFNFVVRALNYLLIFGNFVPISMILTLELAKFCQGYMMGIDQAMVSYNDIPCIVQSSNLNEELGQIDYIFSDKTGTLTKNEMKFKYLVIGDTVYGEKSGYTGQVPKVTNVEFTDPTIWEVIEQGLDRPSGETAKVLTGISLLANCHSVVVEKDGTYNASSPDELAFVNFAKLVGSEFQGMDDDNNMIIDEYGQKKVYKLLDLIEFTSSRQRMTVVVQDQQGKITMFTKGADSNISKRYSPGQERELDHVKGHLNKFADVGLRTLLLGAKEFTPQQYNQFKTEYDVAWLDLGCKKQPRQ